MICLIVFKVAYMRFRLKASHGTSTTGPRSPATSSRMLARILRSVILSLFLTLLHTPT